MKNILSISAAAVVGITVIIIFTAANNNDKLEKLPIEFNFSKGVKDYWLAGKAELSSYDLSKSRYGELHPGEAVLVFVVEPFLPNKQVKSDGFKADEKPERVMKLINSQKFNTGIYPYSIMTSSFYPLNKNRNGVLKVSMSSQDWCGQVYSQINRKESNFEFQKFSYFQKEGDVKIAMDAGLLEEELFSKIRINPDELPIGEFIIYPASEYFRLTHNKIMKYKAKGSLSTIDDYRSIYKLKYVELDRELSIEFESKSPHKILKWTETYSDFSGKRLSSTAKLKKSIRLDYWKYNSVKDSVYREMLALN